MWMGKIRVGFALLLIVMLMMMHDAVYRHIDYAAAAEVPTGETQASRGVAPTLSILEAYDLPGSRVTVIGKAIAEPTRKSDGSLTVRIEDQTGSILLCIDGDAVIRQGDYVQAIGKIQSSIGTAIMKVTSSDIAIVR